MSDTIPVIIPANNECSSIGSCLESLPQEGIMPIVMSNGSTDDTAEIARSYGAKTFELEEASKLGAIQQAFHLTGLSPEDGFVILDADTQLMSRNFAKSLTRHFRDESAIVIAGIIMFSGEHSRRTMLTRSAVRAGRLIARKLINQDVFSGQCEMVKPNADAAEHIMSLPPSIWPGEDVAITDAILKNGGKTELSLDPALAVCTNARGTGSLVKRVFNRKEWMQARHEWWGARAGTDKIDYASYLDMTNQSISPGLEHTLAVMRAPSATEQNRLAA